jgi:chaperonin GroES
MQPKLIQTRVAQYAPAEYRGKNESGYHPIGDRVLVITDQCADKTSGGIYIDPVAAERMTMAAETGTIVELGTSAFTRTADRTRAFDGDRPKPGDRVYIERYSGQVALGRDGQLYRILDDRCIGATMDAPSAIVPVKNPLISDMSNSLSDISSTGYRS